MFGDEQEGAFRGLFISEGEIDALIGQTDRSTLASHTDVSDAVEEFLAAAVFKDVGPHWDLSNFDYGVLVLALAPELDLRYERIYAYLQDDVSKRRPTVDLALNLLCTDWTARLAERQRFAPDAPLLKSGLLRVAATDAAADPPLLARSLRLDDRVVRALIGDMRWTLNWLLTANAFTRLSALRDPIIKPKPLVVWFDTRRCRRRNRQGHCACCSRARPPPPRVRLPQTSPTGWANHC